MENNLATMTTEIPEIPRAVIFHNKDNEEVGRLEFSGKKMVFKGNMESSARLFFTFLVGQFINPYIKEKLSKR